MDLTGDSSSKGLASNVAPGHAWRGDKCSFSEGDITCDGIRFVRALRQRARGGSVARLGVSDTVIG